MGCSCGRNTVEETPESIIKEGSFEDVIKRLSDFLQKYSLADKSNSNYTNHSVVESQANSDKIITISFDLKDESDRKNFTSKIENVKEIKLQLKDLIKTVKIELDLLYDFDSSSNKLFLVIKFENFFGDSRQFLYDAIQNTKSVSVLETKDLVPYDNFMTALSKNTSLKKIIFGTFYEDQLNKFMTALKNHSNIERFTLIDLKLKDDSVQEIFESFLKENKSLKSINLKNNKIDIKGKGLQELKNLLVNSSVPLEKLNLQKNDLKEDQLAENLGQILKSKKFSKLNIVNCKIKTLDVYNNLFNNYILPTSLEVLELSFNSVNLETLSAYIGKNNSLKRLVLQKIKVEPSSKFDELGAAFINSNSLENVGLSYDFISGGNNDNSKFADLFRGFPAGKKPSIAKRLKIYKSDFTSEIGQKIAESYQDSLFELDLSNCVFKDSFQYFTKKFSEGSNLKNLFLNFIEISQGENKHFIQLLEKNKNINTIQYSNPFNTEELNSFGEVIAKSHNLKSVTVQNCLLDDTIAGEFFNKLKNSKIEELDFTTCDSNDNNYGEEVGAFLNSCSTLKIFKIGGKRDNFKVKQNNKIFSITNKSNLEVFSIQNIKFDPSSIQAFLKLTPNLKQITINSSVANSTIFKLLEETSTNLTHLEVNGLPVDSNDCLSISNLVKKLKEFRMKPNKIEGVGLSQIVEGLKNNSNIEIFDIIYDFDDYQFAAGFKTYYQNLLTCPKVKNIIISVQSITGDVEQARKDAIEGSKEIFNSFAKILTNSNNPPPTETQKAHETGVTPGNGNANQADVAVPVKP